MGDPFRDQLVEELEGCLGHRLMAPEGIHEQDIKEILDGLAAAYQEGYRDAEEDIEETDSGEDDLEKVHERIDGLEKALKEVGQ